MTINPSQFATLTAVVYLLGAVELALFVVPPALAGQPWALWSWWQYILAPLPFGAALGLLSVGYESWKGKLERGSPQQRRAVVLFSVLFFGSIIVIAVGTVVQEYWKQ